MKFFTSDLHFDHVNIIDFAYRPWQSVEAMNYALVERWNNTVDVDDEVYIDGDLCMGKRDESLKYVTMLNGRKFLLPGNHDYPWEGHGPRMVDKWKPLYEAAGLEILPGEITMEVGGREVLMCHFPYRGDSRHDERYVAWRPKDKGLPILHGHTHSRLQVYSNQIHVGTDAWSYRPVSEQEIAVLLNSIR